MKRSAPSWTNSGAWVCSAAEYPPRRRAMAQRLVTPERSYLNNPNLQERWVGRSMTDPCPRHTTRESLSTRHSALASFLAVRSATDARQSNGAVIPLGSPHCGVSASPPHAIGSVSVCHSHPSASPCYVSASATSTPPNRKSVGWAGARLTPAHATPPESP